MSTDRQQDAGVDRLLRSALKADAPVSSDACPGADTVAAYAEGGLTPRERSDIEPHLAACARCQAVLSVMARDIAAGATNPAQPAAWRTWLSVPRLRWLVPAGAAAIAIVLYVTVTPEPTGLGDQAQPASAAAPAPEFTVARQLDQVAPTPREKSADLSSSAAPALPREVEKPAQRPSGAGSAVQQNEGRKPPSRPASPSRQGASTPSPAAQNAAVRALPDALPITGATGLQARAEGAAPSVMAAPPPAPAARPAVADSRPTAPLAAGVAPAPSTPERRALAEAAPPSKDLGASDRAATVDRSAFAVAETRAKRDVGAGAGNPAMVSPGRERLNTDAAKGAASEAGALRPLARSPQKAVIEHGLVPGDISLDELWSRSDLVVLARAGSTGKAILARGASGQAGMGTLAPTVPTSFDIIEVLKRKDSVPPATHLTMWQLGGEAEDETTIHGVPHGDWVSIQPGEACLLFLDLREDAEQSNTFEPRSGPKGIYRLDGDRVFVGTATQPEPALSTRELLARLRQLAGTARR